MPKLTNPNFAGSVEMKRQFNRPMTHYPPNNVYHENIGMRSLNARDEIERQGEFKNDFNKYFHNIKL